MSITLVQGDSGIALNGTITNDETNTPLDLTDCDVFFQMRKKDDNRYTVNAACDIITPADGTVRYITATNDLNSSGEYLGQFEVHYPDNSIQTIKDAIIITVRRQ